jgi:hypothetical protein
MVLGEFEFSRFSPRDKQLKHGQILVTLHLAANLDAAKFRRVHDQEKDLQAAVEEAMRRMRASDFADARSMRLKNHIQERLNDELGFEGIDEVVVSSVPDQIAPDQATAEPQGSGDEVNAAEAQSRNAESHTGGAPQPASSQSGSAR